MPQLDSEGGEGVALTPGASLAVDAHLHPLGAPFYVATTTADTDPSPIRAAAAAPARHRAGHRRHRDPWPGARRCVLGLPVHRPKYKAGRMTSRGHFYVLLPKTVAETLSR